jgi:hypothetical protein
MPEIVPAVFKCRQHDRELTAAVLKKVEATRIKVPGSGHRWGSRRRERAFRVVVHCDADDGHDLVFSGTYRP